MAVKSDHRPVSKALRAFALGLPEATEDFPWGERVAKVNKKVFVFLGIDPIPGGEMGLSVKLPESGEEALELPFTKPTDTASGRPLVHRDVRRRQAAGGILSLDPETTARWRREGFRRARLETR